MPVGIHMGQLQAGLNLVETERRIRKLMNGQFQGKTVLLGLDDMDIFKGIGLKVLALEQLMREHPELCFLSIFLCHSLVNSLNKVLSTAASQGCCRHRSDTSFETENCGLSPLGKEASPGGASF